MKHHYFSKASKSRISTCHPLLVSTINKTLKISPWDLGIPMYGGARTEQEQHGLYIDGKSQIDGIKHIGKHQVGGKANRDLSEAIDFFIYPNPYSTNLKDKARYYTLWGIFYAIFQEESRIWEIKHKEKWEISWGVDWDRDGDFKDQSFEDIYHLEISKI